MVYSKNDLKVKKRVTFLFPDDRDDHHNSLRLKTTPQPTAAVEEIVSASKNRPKSSKYKYGNQRPTTSNESSSNKHKGKSKPKKCFVRNTEIPVPPSMASSTGIPVLKGILKHPVNNYENTETSNEYFPKENYRSKFAYPELYTSLGIAKKISSTKLEKIKPQTETPPLVQQIVDEKAACRLNFPLEERVYRDLVALNVSDEDMVKDTAKHAAKEFEATRKDREPQLKDFFIPQFGKEYGSMSKHLPCNVEKVRRYNGHSVYDRTQLWEQAALD